MEAILHNLAGWFSSVLVSIVASVVAGFVQPYAGKVVARCSTRYRTWRANKDAELQRHVQQVSGNDTLVLAELLRAVLCLLLFVGTSSFYMLLSIISTLTGGDPLLAVIGLFSARLAVLSGYRSAGCTRQAVLSLQAYREKLAVPSTARLDGPQPLQPHEPIRDRTPGRSKKK